MSTPDQPLKGWQPQPVRTDGLRSTSFLSRPPSVRPSVSPPHLPPFSAFTSPFLPFLKPSERHNQLFILSQQRERGREMLSTVTRQAPSLSLQTFQEISGETLLLQAQGFQRSPLALASPDPAGFGTEGREREGRLAEQPGRAETGEDAAQERRAEMLAASGWAPFAAGHVWGNPGPLRGPQGRKSRVATPSAAVPKRQLCCGGWRRAPALLSL